MWKAYLEFCNLPTLELHIQGVMDSSGMNFAWLRCKSLLRALATTPPSEVK